ncbi:hypothetical protein GGR50DRAFT_46820 [Xylaria sp. CBS 124048]|nr:hypothetical protein GGR50DRAFT_46820 [Xylaria sp. CBS 124048]
MPRAPVLLLLLCCCCRCCCHCHCHCHCHGHGRCIVVIGVAYCSNIDNAIQCGMSTLKLKKKKKKKKREINGLLLTQPLQAISSQLGSLNSIVRATMVDGRSGHRMKAHLRTSTA